jgi:transcriptional regulator with XRE-family HTH domain
MRNQKVMNIHIAENLKFLRKRRRYSQQDLSDSIGIKRSTYGAYELGQVEPGLEMLLTLSEFFRIPLDALVRTNLTALPGHIVKEMELGYGTDISGRSLRVLATTVNQDNLENIEVVPVKAKAGYTAGYADPDYIRVLPTFHLPFLDRDKKYRTFQITGDSMPPVGPGAWVTGYYVQDWQSIRDGQPYIFVLREEGVVFKVAYNRLSESGTLLLCSTNPAYAPYSVKPEEILEVWQFVNYISPELPDVQAGSDELQTALAHLQREVADLKRSQKNN